MRDPKQRTGSDLLRGRNVLVTGGTGSIGSEIVRQVLSCQPRVVRILSRDEHKQYELQHELREYANVRYLIGDVRSQERLEWAFEDIEIVFHAAAMKHVSTCEYNPWEAIETNVVGTQNVVKAALRTTSVLRVICISTDKAVAPISVLGASKLLSEKVVTRGNFYSTKHKPVFCSVRFGNVINSRGSFTSRVVQQIAHGGPVTLTDGEMIRFMMSRYDAVRLVLRAAHYSRGGEVFILKMPLIRMGDMVRVMIDHLAPQYGYRPEQIKIEIVGARLGEKLSESLLTKEESKRCLETSDMWILLPPPREWEDGGRQIEPQAYPDAKRFEGDERLEISMKSCLSPAEIVRQLLKPADIL